MKHKRVKVHIVTDYDKRKSLYNFCLTRKMCNECLLDKGFPCGSGVHFFTKHTPNKYDMSKDIIDKAYKKIFIKNKRRDG